MQPRLQSIFAPVREKAALANAILAIEFVPGERLGTALAVALGLAVVACFALLMGMVY